jgi:Domain of unknown function (DUF4157)
MHESDFSEQVPVHRRSPVASAGPVPAGAAVDPAAELPSQMGNREFTRHVAQTGGAPIQRDTGRSQGAGPLDPEIEADIRSAQGGGRPLDDHVRGDMESHFGVDLSAVRVHADSRADALSRSVQADAFTTGTDVFFRSGRFTPESGEGRKLLAHELTHVVDQASGSVPAESRVSHPDDPHEVRARAMADAVASTAVGVPAVTGASASATVQRQAFDDEQPDDPISVSRQPARDEEDDAESV